MLENLDLFRILIFIDMIFYILSIILRYIL